jgi:hypothetical protein
MLLRLAFWLAVVVFMLPSDPQQQARLRATVMSIMGRATAFCDRNDRTCAAGGEAWATFLRKAEFGMRLVGDLIGGGGPQPDWGPPPPDRRWNGRPDRRPPPPVPPGFHQPPWGGPNGGG